MRNVKYLSLLTLAVLLATSLSTSAQDAAATQNNADVGGVNVTHPKSWYDKFTYGWPYTATNQTTSKITDKADDPDQIIALLRYIYMTPEIPGIYQAAYGNTSGQNLTTRYRNVYYGGIDGGWDIPFNSANDRYTDYTTYKPKSEGYTVLLVAVRDNFAKNDLTSLPFSTMNYDALRDFIANSIEYVQLLTDGMRLNEGLISDGSYLPGTIFTVTEAPGLNRFFFLSKGQARDIYHTANGDEQMNRPFGRMFEQFSPTDGTEGSQIENYYEALKLGNSYPIQHDCNSVLSAEHYFSMVGKNATGSDSHQDVSGLQFFIPDQRLTYFGKPESKKYVSATDTDRSYRYFNVQSHNVTHDGRIMNYDEGWANYSGSDGPYVNGYKVSSYDGYYYNYRCSINTTALPTVGGQWHWGSYAEIAYYNSDYSPSTSWYRIELTATPTKSTSTLYGEHTYEVALSWQSTTDKLSKTPVEQVYWVYEIRNGEEVLISPEEGISKTTWTVTDNADDLYVEQYPSGRKLTYVVKGRPAAASYDPIRSNADDAIIPGYDKRERLALSIGTDYYSKYYPVDEDNQYNQYCNAILISNGTGTAVTKSFINSNVKFSLFRSWEDEDGVENTVKFAEVSFTNWSNRNQSTYTVNYLNDSQKGSVTGKTPRTTGTLTLDGTVQENVVFGTTTAPFEILDIFQASTKENTHPSAYVYQVKFESATEFEMDELDDDGNPVYVEATDGTYKWDDELQKYVYVGENNGGTHKVKSTTATEVTSNKETIPVFKSTYSLYSDGYTQTQIDEDSDNDMDNLLEPHMVFTQTADGGEPEISTKLNRVKLYLQANSTSAIYQYELYRNPMNSETTGAPNNKIVFARAQASNESYSITQNNDANVSTERGNASVGDYDFADEAVLKYLPASVSYVPVISTRPKDQDRLTKGDYNTYGADIKRVGLPNLDVHQSENPETPMVSFYRWPKADPQYAYFHVQLDAKGELPDAVKYSQYGWRSWRKMEDISLAAEEYPSIVRNLPAGYMFDDLLRRGDLVREVGAETIDYGEILNTYGQLKTVNGILKGTFGAKLNTDINLDYKVRMYYLVKDVAAKAPRRVKGELVSPTGTYYVVDYDLPMTMNSENVVTGVDTVDATREVAGVTYYNGLGQMSMRPFGGVNIVVTRYTDGTTDTAKVVY